MNPARFPHKLLVRWYQTHRRRLPWRENPAAYKVWVSEIMLQQTQVKNAVPYFNRFIRAFPSFRALARAGEPEVLRLWSGLGYYSRARNLLKTAKIVSAEFSGQFPKEMDQITKLPGIGPYTAGAILSIAYNLPVPIVDGNVRRVLSRFFLVHPQDKIWELSGKIVARAAEEGFTPSDFNQSLMELGALVCLPKNPSCGECPIRTGCKGNQKGLTGFYPKTVKKTKKVFQTFALAIARQGGVPAGGKTRLLVHQRSGRRKWLKNLWEFPILRVSKKNNPRSSTQLFKRLSGRFSERIRSEIKIKKYLGTFSHSITFRRLKIHVYEGESKNGGGAAPHPYDWVRPAHLQNLSCSSMMKKAFSIYLSVRNAL